MLEDLIFHILMLSTIAATLGVTVRNGRRIKILSDDVKYYRQQVQIIEDLRYK